MKPFTLFRAWLICALVWCCCSSLCTAQIYQNSFLYPSANHDHNSVAEAYTGGNTVQAGTLFAAGLNAAHFQEVDDAGNLVWESAKVQANNIPVRAFHIDQDPFNTLAASGTNNFYFGGILEGAAGNTGVLGFVSDGGGMANYLELIAAGWVHTSVLHVSPAETPTPAYLVTGFVAQGFADTDQKQGFVAMIDQASLTVTWSRFIDSSPLYSNDFDLLSNGIELPGQGFFLSGSVNGFGGQSAYAAKFDYAGNLIWDEGYHYDTAPNGEYNIASSAVYDPAGDRIYQLVNLSETHCFAISAYDASAGALVRLPESMTFINGNYSNTAGYSLHMDPSGGSLTVAGLVRDAAASGFDADGNPISISGSFPFMLNVNLAGTAINWQHTYPVPSSGYSNSSDIYDSFSAGQQPRVLYPEMAHPKGDGTGYVLNAFRFDALTDPYELEAIETDLLGQNPCEQEPLGISFFTESWVSEDVTFIQTGSVDEVSGFLIEIGSTQVDHPCGSIQDPDCQFTMDWDYVLDPDICGQVFFQDLTVAAAGTSLCYTWDFGDGNSSTLASPTHMYAADGVYTVCLTVQCCDDPTGASKVQICKDIVIECGTGLCTPDPSFEIVDLDDCCIEIVDLNPSGLSCERWIITGPDGTDNIYTGTSITLCDLTPGTWTICHEDCCVNPDGTLTTLAMCLIWDAQDCGCTPDPTFAIDPTSNCCYAFADPTPDPDLDCSTWEITDTLDGTVIATHSGEFWNYCFTQDGVYEICHTDCCVNADGTLTYATYCQTLTIEGCGGCTPDAFFVIDPMADCCYAFADLTPDPNSDCSTWEIRDILTGALVTTGNGEFFEFCFTSNGVYEVCHTDCCIHTDGTVHYATSCQSLVVENCGCDLPNADEMSLVLVDSDINCNTWGACVNLPAGSDPTQYCIDWYWGDGTVQTESAAFCPMHTYDCNGAYEVCAHIYCCDDPTNVVVLCGSVEVNCPCTLPQVDFGVTVNDDCTATATLFGIGSEVCPDDVCYNWTVIEPGAGVIVTGTGADFTFPGDGTYQICLEVFCCIDSTIGYSLCQLVTVDCPCTLPTDLGLEVVYSGADCKQIGVCVTGGGSDLCVDYIWGDGTSQSEILDFCPIHTYACSGVYELCAEVYCCDNPDVRVTLCETVVIECPCDLPSNVDFTLLHNDDCTVTPVVALPEDPCDNICYEWFSPQPGVAFDPITGTFSFPGSGAYIVCLNVYCCDGSGLGYTVCQDVQISCPCDLPSSIGFDPIVDGCTVNPNLWYTDDYTGPLCFFWSFGDGTTSTDENATHTYTASGTYTICLTVSCCDDPAGASSITVCQEVTVNCDCPQPCELYPAFNALMDPITVETGCCMQFYNNSMAGPHTTITGYLWDFGDGATSTDANPFHCFLNGPGAYTVCLTVFGSSPEGECAQTFCFTFNCDCEDTCPEDVNHDGYIGVSDLLQVLGKFQQQCP